MSLIVKTVLMFGIYTDTISLTFYMIPYNDCFMQPKHVMNNLSAVVSNSYLTIHKEYISDLYHQSR